MNFKQPFKIGGLLHFSRYFSFPDDDDRKVSQSETNQPNKSCLYLVEHDNVGLPGLIWRPDNRVVFHHGTHQSIVEEDECKRVLRGPLSI